MSLEIEKLLTHLYQQKYSKAQSSQSIYIILKKRKKKQNQNPPKITWKIRKNSAYKNTSK